MTLLGIAGAFALQTMAVTPASKTSDDPAGVAFFETHVRPLLAERCYECHSGRATRLKAGLRLDHREFLLRGGDSGPAIVPGDAAASLLWKAVSGADEKLRMPPKNPLSAVEVDTVRRWIELGAPYPAGAEIPSSPATSHWAFQPIPRPAVPPVRQASWVKSPVDCFVLARLEAAGLAPSPEAPRRVLARRLCLDLTGIAPTPEQVAAFEVDERPDAYERLVDMLLESPHYGEHWGRHWLDLARYADSGGYEMDFPRSAWRYRDWVIRALNSGMAFDRFVIEQLAGDLLPGATEDQIMATAFHGNSMLDRNLPWEANIERLTTTGSVFLGLTLGCAQCHNHKTDPLTSREFYQLYSFFNQAETLDKDVSSTEVRAAHAAAARRVESAEHRLKAIQIELEPTLAAWEAGLSPSERARLAPAVRAVLEIPATSRNDEQRATLREARLALDPAWKELSREVEDLRKKVPALDTIPVLRHEPRETRMFVRGNPEKPGDRIEPGLPAFLPGAELQAKATRLDLARWIVSPTNPLTARVTVNRIWQAYFGLGLVETENDFGVQTPPPSHPALLDWLASEFMRPGGASDPSRRWNLKALHRQIVLSSTYRQASARRPDLDAVDPRNRLLARQQRFRLEAEAIRDNALAVSGLLDSRIGGPGIFPFQHEGVLDFRATKAEWVMSSPGDRHRRGLYVWFWRLTPYPYLTLFDAPDAVTTATRRLRSNTPTQALTLLNDPVFIECARALAKRLPLCRAEGDPAVVRAAFRLGLGREPSTGEMNLLIEALAAQRAEFSSSPAAARRLLGDDRSPEHHVVEQAARTILARSVLNLDEFITRE